MVLVTLACVVAGICIYVGIKGTIEAFLGTWSKHTLVKRRWY